jgi:DNA primase
VALFPQAFLEELRARADLLQVVQERVALRRAGSGYKGLCPFHTEKTPSFHVHPDRGFFHCFGCGAGGDVFTFVELADRLTFPEAVRQLAARVGLPVPDPSEPTDEAARQEREALVRVHEAAAAWFREQLASPAGARARRHLEARGLEPATVEALGYGYAPASRDRLRAHLESRGFALPLLLTSGLVLRRDDGSIVDRFRDRLMIPIHRESGAIVAFGGRALGEEQQPKYLNSPETPIYAKSRTIYGLHLTKGDIRRAGHAILVEGYFDFAQAWQAGVRAVVASSGTALAPAQARLLRRFTGRLILSFDPDAAGEGAAARSSELLVAEGFDVRVARLPEGRDPDTFIRESGGAAYAEAVEAARPYLEYLLERAERRHDLDRDEGRRAFLEEMLGVAARIPDPAARDQFADRLAHRARVLDEVVRTEIRRAAARRATLAEAEAGRGLRLLGEVRPAEKGLIRAMLEEPAAALAALADLDEADFDGLAAGDALRAAWRMRSWPPEAAAAAWLERLDGRETALVEGVRSERIPAAPPRDCARAIRRLRYERERAAVQEAIDRLARGGAAGGAEIDALLARKHALARELEALNR